MDLESSSESEKNTSLTLQTANDCSAHSTQDPSEKTSSECKENVKDSDGSKSETCHSETSENLSKCENSLINNDSVINGKHDEKDEPSDSKETTLKNENSEMEPTNATKSSLSDKIECSEESLSSDGQNEQISNGLSSSSDLNDGKGKCHSKVSELASQDVKTKDNIKETVCTTTKSESSLSHSRSFSVITRSKQSAKKGMSNANNRDKTEKSFVLSEVTDDDIEQIKDDSCFPDYLANLLSVGRYIPVKIVNPSDYRPKNNETLIEAPSLTVPLLVKERNIYFDKTYKPERRKNTANSTQDNYFSNSVGQFLIGLGFSRVREWYHRDMTKVKERQIRRSGKSAELESELQEHRNEHLQAKQANEPFSCPMKKCQMCPFQTESHLILEGHYLTPHVSSRREYLCNFCNFNSRDPKLILFHMEAIHSKHGIIDLPVFYECPFCSFESHLKTKFSSHITRCQRTFRCAFNQSAPRDFPYPTLTPKPVTTSDIKEYENNFANLGNSMPYSTKSSQKYLMSHSSGSNRPVISNMPTLYQQLASVEYQQLHHLSANNVQLLSGSGVIRTKYPVMNQVHCGQNKVPFPITSNHIYHFVNSNGQLVPVMGKDLVNPTSRLSFLQNSAESNSQPRKSSHGSSHDSGSMARIIKSDGKKNIVTLQPSESKTSSISHAPRAHATQSAQSPKSTLPKVATSGQSSKIVICEICDGYIKDLEQLQTHMHWIHKVKIHPKMLASRPPLNCQKCQSRFFTDQGLERHLLGTHGLVTPNMQDMANKNQDGGCCTICRQFYACKLVAHISQVHKITLKPAHLSYKCTVCSATFSLYRQFENHVYSVHSGSGKRSADSDSTQSSKKAALSLAGKKINSLVDKQGKILEKNTSLSSNKGELGDLASNHAGTNSLNYFKDKQGKHSLQPLTRLKRRKFLRSSDGQ